MIAKRPSATEVFNVALDSFGRGDLEEAAACLRAGFFENVYMAPVLLREEFPRQNMWHAGSDAEPRAATEYLQRYGGVWGEREDALRFLEDVWRDPLVRSEVKRFINLSKAILQMEGESRQSGLMKERERFVDFRRISRTQSEILARLESSRHHRPLERPRLALVLLAARDPEATVKFYRQVFQIEPVRTSRLAGGYAEFELPGVRLAIHGHDRLGAGDPYGLGPSPGALGWGAIFAFRVSELDRYYDNAAAAGIEVVGQDLETYGERFFLLKDPSGYLIEITEQDEPRGL
ncbi:MAG: VOC family protein [Planctomycetota bacterium]|nr:VOC family protein [Planctomycetota bacterium]